MTCLLEQIQVIDNKLVEIAAANAEKHLREWLSKLSRS